MANGSPQLPACQGTFRRLRLRVFYFLLGESQESSPKNEIPAGLKAHGQPNQCREIASDRPPTVQPCTKAPRDLCISLACDSSGILTATTPRPSEDRCQEPQMPRSSRDPPSQASCRSRELGRSRRSVAS